jgi:hypothetical protein
LKHISPDSKEEISTVERMVRFAAHLIAQTKLSAVTDWQRPHGK